MAEKRIVRRPLVWAGVHGEAGEYLPGVPLVHSLMRKSLRRTDPETNEKRYVWGQIANCAAVELGVRAVHANLALSISDRSNSQTGHEGKLAPIIIARSLVSDLVVDVHGNRFNNKNYAYIGPNVYSYVLGFLAMMGISEVVVTNASLPALMPQAVSLDIANSHMHATFWKWVYATRGVLRTAITSGIPVPEPSELRDMFTFYGQASLTEEESRLTGVDRYHADSGEIVPSVADILGLPGQPVSLMYGAPWPMPEVMMPLPEHVMRFETTTSGDSIISLPHLRQMPELLIQS